MPSVIDVRTNPGPTSSTATPVPASDEPRTPPSRSVAAFETE
jgi:hypothetical protein